MQDLSCVLISLISLFLISFPSRKREGENGRGRGEREIISILKVKTGKGYVVKALANDDVASVVHIVFCCGSQIWLCFRFLGSILGLLNQSPQEWARVSEFLKTRIGDSHKASLRINAWELE